jgi:hypothetical protein
VRLPAKDDPGGDREGSLTRETVLEVLRENDTDIQHLGNHLYLLMAGDEVTSQVFEDRVGGLMIRRLSRQFQIQITDFYYYPCGGRRP